MPEEEEEEFTSEPSSLPKFVGLPEFAEIANVAETIKAIEKQDERIRGKVAEVVSDREVILNRGLNDGVTTGMYFAILDPGAVGITDPDTGAPLGDIKVVKIVVRAVEVAPKITLARTFRTRRVNLGGQGVGVSNIFAALQEPKYVEQVERLTLDRNAPRKIDPKDSVVGRGDPFESADPDEVEDVRSITVWEER